MSASVTDLLAANPLFGELASSELAALASAAEKHEFGRDVTIFAMQQPADGLYVLVSGRVKVCVSTSGGKEIILATLGPGQFVGEMALLDNEPRSASVVTQLPTTAYRIRRAEFERLLEAYPAIARKLLRELSLRLRRANAQMESLVTLDVIGRLARFFIDLARQHGQMLGNGWVAVRRPTHQDIAASVGTSRETVTRLITELETRGLVVNEGKMSYLREEALVEEGL
ncbi:MAG: Crp/Fnr family transcriptional regulator [Thermoanaerobaculaceae bacterium]|nr:Crp/Fnr family transcriptional regulator [Thermoanaerobaculaceae bacterium]MDI9622229.1 Crp/Fnr family transcriptional regulator [Acidobacteriota bacterium]NLH10539.1 Crp/Fnr family transcriptional regulator [Holophagae bacterium]HPW56853.1 Crp/Fnr family transcriptional regulator [Thermoanaerobaculaceae bacterium]